MVDTYLNQVYVVSTLTYTVTTIIPTPTLNGTIFYYPTNGLIYVSTNQNITVINSVTNTLLGSVVTTQSGYFHPPKVIKMF